jgi:hypothetical protein
MNQASSRSHSIFQIKYERVQNQTMFRSKLNLCDLAGSEKLNKQAKQIQLLARGSAFIPFRDSNLTRLLQDSFQGGTKTLLIATVSPSAHNTEETISTMKFADRAKNVM